MGLKITYTDTVTNKVIEEIELTDEKLKALSVDIADVVEWHINFLKHRKRQCINKIVEYALKPKSPLLSDTNRQAIAQFLAKKGIIICSPHDLPDDIKLEIVKKANIDVLKPKSEKS